MALSFAGRAIAPAFMLIALVTPESSSAANVDFSVRLGDPDLQYRASPDEANRVLVSVEAGRVVFRDTAPLHASGRCEKTGPDEVRCPLPDPHGLDARLGDGADRIEVDAEFSLRVEAGPGADVVLGAGGPSEWLLGEDGDDEIRGRSGTDNVLGGDGDDLLVAGDGAGQVSELRGNAGRDKLVGGPGREFLKGGGGEDVLLGAGGDDRVEANKEPDEIDGGPGDDYLTGNQGNDVIAGGDDTDKAFGGPGEDRVRGGDGNDHVAGVGGDDVIDGDAGNDRVFGGEGEDDLEGGDGDDRFGTIERNSLGGRLDSNADTVACGLGIDSVRSAPPDLLDGECERALVWNSTLVAAPAPTVEDDAAVLSVSCGNPAGCHGMVTLSLAEPGRELGEARIDLPPGAEPTAIRVPLTSDDAALLQQGALVDASYLEDADPPGAPEGYHVRVPAS